MSSEVVLTGQLVCRTEAEVAHQDRVAESVWGQASRGIERRYEIEGLQI